jgi:hypothetical protein
VINLARIAHALVKSLHAPATKPRPAYREQHADALAEGEARSGRKRKRAAG